VRLWIEITGEGVFLVTRVNLPIIGEREIRERLDRDVRFENPLLLHSISFRREGGRLKAVVFEVEGEARPAVEEAKGRGLERFAPYNRNLDSFIEFVSAMGDDEFRELVKGVGGDRAMVMALYFMRRVPSMEVVGEFRSNRGSIYRVLRDPERDKYYVLCATHNSVTYYDASNVAVLKSRFPRVAAEIMRLIDAHRARRDRERRERLRRAALQEREVFRESL